MSRFEINLLAKYYNFIDYFIMKGLDKNQDKYHIIHLLDCIYYGNLNYSYQKEGFGIQQSFDFHTYIGYWKSNRI